MSDNGALALDHGGGVDGVGTEVGVGHWGVDSGDNWGNLGCTVVVGSIDIAVSEGRVEESWVSLGLALDESLLLKGTDGASLGGDASLGGVEGSVVVAGSEEGGSQENLWISLSLTLVQTVDGGGGSRIRVGVAGGHSGSDDVWGVNVGGVDVRGVESAVEEGRIGFRLCQALRGNGENYDLKINPMSIFVCINKTLK